MNVLIRIHSHRARAKLYAALGREPQGFFRWNADGEFREITLEELQALPAIKGISTPRRIDRSTLRRYWPKGA